MAENMPSTIARSSTSGAPLISTGSSVSSAAMMHLVTWFELPAMDTRPPLSFVPPRISINCSLTAAIMHEAAPEQELDGSEPRFLGRRRGNALAQAEARVIGG